LISLVRPIPFHDFRESDAFLFISGQEYDFLTNQEPSVAINSNTSAFAFFNTAKVRLSLNGDFNVKFYFPVKMEPRYKTYADLWGRKLGVPVINVSSLTYGFMMREFFLRL
jgi:hypothetical protein